MKSFYLGVDGGGTKTQCLLCDGQGRVLDMLTGGPSNHEVLPGGFAGMETTLRSLISELLGRNQLLPAQVTRAVLGLAGADTCKQKETIRHMIARTGLPDFLVCNDAFLGIRAAIPSGTGINAVNGTGCSVAGINAAGDMLQIGGFGPSTGDIGGGPYIGEQMLSAVYAARFRTGAPTLLSSLLPEPLRSASPMTFTDMMQDMLASGSLRPSALCLSVFDASVAGDPVADRILENVGAHLGCSVCGMVAALFPDPAEPVSIVFSGSVHTRGKSPVLLDTLMQQVRRTYPSRTFHTTRLEVPPVLGAVAWALEGQVPLADILRHFAEVPDHTQPD